MNMNEASAARVTVHSELKRFFWPVTKVYTQRVIFFALYCAFVAAAFIFEFPERFRVGGAFVAIFIGAGVLAPWVDYFKSIKAIEQSWPSQAKQDELYADFAISKSVFKDEGRIGRIYSFWRKDSTILPLKDIQDFAPARVRAGVQMKAVLKDAQVTVAQFPYNKSDLQELAQLLDDAKDCLKERR